jgi:hypothetical protein
LVVGLDRARDFKNRSSGVQADHRMRLEKGERISCDGLLRMRVLLGAEPIVQRRQQVGDRTHPAMHDADQVLLFEPADIAPDGHVRDAQLLTELGQAAVARFSQAIEDDLPPGMNTLASNDIGSEPNHLFRHRARQYAWTGAPDIADTLRGRLSRVVGCTPRSPMPVGV